MATKTSVSGSTTSRALRARWRRWITRLHSEVSGLLISVHLFGEVRKIVEANPRIAQPFDFHSWLIRNYSMAAAVTIRRLMDSRPDTVSLFRLLKEMEVHADVISRRSYVALFPGPLREAAHRQFDMQAGAKSSSLAPSTIAADLRALTQAHDRIRIIVNKRFAHLDRRNLRRRPPKMAELETVARLFERTLLKYQVLLTATGQTSLLPTWQYDWKSVFRAPWIEGRGQELADIQR